MGGILETPSLWILGTIIIYGIAYSVYAKWVDRNVWQVDPKKTTPAHMYMDGVEFFPVSRYVLYGFQFKSIAALGPILGPFIGVSYGWIPALLWIIFGNFFIGWVQDYSAIMLTVRNEGRSMGPLMYEVAGEGGRKVLLSFLLFYLLIISAVFIYLISLFWNVFAGSFIATMGIILTGLLAGYLIYKVKANIFGVTILVIILTATSVIIGTLVPWPPKDFAGPWTIYLWSAILAVILFAGALLPLPKFITPMNYVAVFPAIGGVIMIILGALLTPVFGITLLQPGFVGWIAGPGPLWPIIFVSIACGAISGWHSLVGTSTTGKQLDVETDARPVGAGAMLTEGTLALSALAAYMVVSPDLIAKGKVAAFVNGAALLSAPYLGGDLIKPYLITFFSIFLVIYAITVQTLVTRYWRVFSAELFQRGALRIFGDKYVATFIGLLIPILFALSGSWINLWIYFGGSNQLLAGLALLLVSIYVLRMKRPAWYSFYPAIFMTVTTLAALLWEIYTFAKPTFGLTKPLANPPLSAYPAAAWTLNAVFFVVGIVLFILGIYVAYILFKAYAKTRVAPPS